MTKTKEITLPIFSPLVVFYNSENTNLRRVKDYLDRYTYDTPINLLEYMNKELGNLYERGRLIFSDLFSSNQVKYINSYFGKLETTKNFHLRNILQLKEF